jgi:penicillin G amidase
MKVLRKLFVVLGIVAGIVAMVSYFLLLRQKPQYRGQLGVKGLTAPAEIYYDAYGIPHIYASNEADLYFALGYAHAQDRLFQMELLRRVSAGRLSEIFGKELVETDRFFRMLGLNVHAQESAQLFYNDTNTAYKRATNAYLLGINRFIEEGPTPLEFILADIPKEKYSIKDLFLVVNYMAFNFAMGFKTDPLLSKFRQKLGDRYTNDLALDYLEGSMKAPVSVSDSMASFLSQAFHALEERLPVPIWTGSNAWVLAPRHSASGKVLFSNDAHIGFSQPCVWYEAHLECPGFSFYGNHLAGFPFAPIGHTRKYAWGLTMFENDDMDFYSETLNPADSGQVMYQGQWVKIRQRKEHIMVKGEKSEDFTVRLTPHGPLCNRVMKGINQWSSMPVSVWWTYTKFPCNLLKVMYDFSHASSLGGFQHSVSEIVGPGVNVLYGDADGNIAWWTAAKLMKRAPGIMPAMFLDGASGKNDPVGYFDFAANPKSVNPISGMVFSANSQPDAMEGQDLYPGYYTPDDRLRRIMEMLEKKEKYSVSEMEAMQLDDLSTGSKDVVNLIYRALYASNVSLNSEQARVLDLLVKWDGNHSLESVEPVIYYAWIYRILKNCMSDEVGEKDLEAFIVTHVMKNSIPKLLRNQESAWWDNVNTKDKKESESDILVVSLTESLTTLKETLGEDPSSWKWKRVHTLEHMHALGKKKPLNHLFNVGPFASAGGNETLNQMGFDMNESGFYPIRYGPAMRITLDFDDVENSRSILPTGQSGNVMSRHYNDQADLYMAGKTRKQMMNKKEIMENSPDRLTLQPK